MLGRCIMEAFGNYIQIFCQRTPIINIFTNSVHGHYTIDATTLKVKFSVVENMVFCNFKSNVQFGI